MAAAPRRLSEPEQADRLSWEAIQARAEASVKTSVVQVVEWGGDVKVRGLYLSEARDVRERATGVDGEVDAALVACYTIAYGMTEPRIPMDEAWKLNEHGTGVIFKVFQVIDRLTGVSEQEVKRATEAFRDA